MQVDLVRVSTSDGLRLHGAFSPASAPPGVAADPVVDAFLCLHGVSSNFYGSSLFAELVEPLTHSGAAVLRVNTRGHDGVAVIATNLGGKRQGSAYELVDHCRYDVAAWLDWLEAQGYRRLAVLGHSLGAIKAVYALAHEPRRTVTHLLAASPPSLAHQSFLNGPRGGDFREALAAAHAAVEAGRPDALIEVKVPFPLVMAAGGYLDKYGPEDRYDILRHVHKLRCPTLFVYGQRELDSGNVAFADLPAKLAAAPAGRATRETTVVPGADHNYTGRRAELAAALLGWLGESQPDA